MFLEVLPRYEEMRPVEPRDVEIETEFRRDVSRETALAASRRAVHQKADSGVDAFCLEVRVALGHAEEFVKRR